MLDRKAFFAHVRASVFDGFMSSVQVAGVGALLDAFDKHAVPDLRCRACMLGTTWWETGRTMQPVREVGEGRGRAYGIPTGPWHQVYYGRGDVQETWLANYQHATIELRKVGAIGADVDLARTPELMLQPDIAAATLIFGMAQGWFTGRKLADYFGPHGADWFNARRIINGTDHAADVAAAAQHFWAALKAASVAPAAA